jgi:Flp pilus assembly protein TadG
MCAKTAALQTLCETKKMRSLLARFLRDDKATVAVITAFTALPMLFLIGAGIDYGIAVQRQAQLNGYADAAALAAVTPTMMAQSASAATTAAQNTFNAQAGALTSVTYSPSNLQVAINSSGNKRVATVTYSATYQTSFATILGMSSMPLSGSSAATAGMPPNIDFYLLLDDSPSMAIAATQAGINTMVTATPTQGGCAFACHQTNASADNLGNPLGVDNYSLARTLAVTLRIDLLRQAVQNLMSTAQTTEVTNGAAYRMAINTFDVAFNSLQALTSNLTTAQTSAGNIALLTVYSNNWLTSSNNNSDTDTNYDQAMSGANTLMPNPGSGTNVAGDTPQEVLFFVTDGVEDELVNGSRKQSLMDPAWCTTIKNRGIRIAVLYTEYLPLPTNSWYNTYVAPFQNNIAPTLQSCASTGLFFQVNTGGDISAALASLFQYAIQSAFLSY